MEQAEEAERGKMRSRVERLTSRSSCAACLLALCMCGAVAHASTVPHGRTLVIGGAGDGHGVGMSQDGAFGYAEHGYAYAAILEHYYTGTALGRTPGSRKVRVLMGGRVVRVPLERYVRGVVSAEMPASWPMAALEAQAVASRTYALTDHAGGGAFDVYADTRSQVYLGKAAETPRTNAAVAATARQIVTYHGKPAITYFFASSGGMTEDIQDAWPGAEAEPWLRGVQDPYEGGQPHTWTVRMSFARADSLLQGLVRGSFVGIEVLKRGFSPRIVSANILGTNGNAQVSGPELEARLGLDSTWAYFSAAGPAGVHREPDRSHYSPSPPGSQAPASGTPSGGSAPSAPPGSEHGGVSAALGTGPGGGTYASAG
jgi:SpoIID/LytB domain protein